jgi:excisionase family DNA binding protein
MGAYPNRYEERADRKSSHGADARSNTVSLAGSLVNGGASGQSAHAIEPITMRVPDACRYIGISRSTLYLLIADGELEVIKLGCSTLVLTESLKALIGRRRDLSEISAAQNGG